MVRYWLRPFILRSARGFPFGLFNFSAVGSLPFVTAIYMDVYPLQVLANLEDLLRRINFERSVEGKVFTQGWYVRQLIADYYAEFLREVVTVIAERLDSLFLAPPKKLLAGSRVAEASVWLQRTIEACSKADHQIRLLANLYGILKDHHHTEAPWYQLGDVKASSENIRYPF